MEKLIESPESPYEIVKKHLFYVGIRLMFFLGQQVSKGVFNGSICGLPNKEVSFFPAYSTIEGLLNPCPRYRQVEFQIENSS